jgi:hypothetical protein
MLTLVLALYPEGATDAKFLPVVIQRTAEMVIAARSRSVVDVLEPFVIPVDSDKKSRAERILAAAQQTQGYHGLIVHADADSATRERALQERIQPGKDLVLANGLDHCLIPLIPVRMTEAWMLADPQALLDVIGTNMSVTDLGLPAQSRLLESDTTPKRTLERVVQVAVGQRRRRRIKLADLYAPLAQRINLEYLNELPAFQKFVQDLSDALVDLSIIIE